MRRFLYLLLSLLFRSFHNRIGFVGARLITVMLNRCSRLSSTTRAREGERNSLKFRIIYFNDWVQTNPPDSQIVILQWHCNVRYTYLGFMVVGALIRMSACQTCSRAHIRASVKWRNEVLTVTKMAMPSRDVWWFVFVKRCDHNSGTHKHQIDSKW